MFVIKRSGEKETVRFDKITRRLEKLLNGINTDIVDPIIITQKISSRIYSGITTVELDNLASQICMSMVTEHPDFGVLGSRLIISNHQKNTKESFLDVLNILTNNKDIQGNPAPLVSEELLHIATQYEREIENIIDLDRDYLLDFFSFKTLEKSYLLKVDKKVIERPQHLFMRVAIGIHGDDLENIEKTYNKISLKKYTHATPTLFNAGTNHPQLSSCYLSATEDSIEGIFETITDCAKISKWSGGIGVHISNIRANGSYIRKTAGYSDGIMPMLKVYNDVARYVNQGGGKRNGSFAMYIEPHHADIFTFLNAKKPHGADEDRARDLFYALWIPDLFMKRVEEDGDWYLMCPDKCPNLPDVYGDEYDKLYQKYVDEKRYNKKIKARELWEAIIASQVETGTPYMLYKDSCNKKSNQKNIGTIKSSNLCSEIIEVSNKDETAVCNLASICLQNILEIPDKHEFINTLNWTKLLTKEENNMYKYYFEGELKLFSKENCVYCKLLKGLLKKTNLKYEEISADEAEMLRLKSNPRPSTVKPFETVPQLFSVIGNDVEHLGGYTDVWNYLKPRINYTKLAENAYELTINLNKIIDKNFYPIEKTKTSNFRHRPVGIGVQGLSDLFMKLKIAFDSEEASEINKKLFETIYYGAMCSSINLAETDGAYETYQGSPLSQGLFQFNLWGMKDSDLSGLWDWGEVREKLLKVGARNSLLIALMPTASTSQIMTSNECIEPYTSNVYTRRTLAGEFTVMNPYLIQDLIDLDMWNDDVKNRLLYDKGSVQNIKELPKFLKEIYKTVYEIKQKTLITLSAERSPFVCQSQSLNLFFEKPDFNKLTNAHFLGWKLGLKTGSYYIRSKPAVSVQRFGLDTDVENKLKKEDEPDICLNCSA